MINRENKLAAAKRKLEKFQKTRTNTAGSVFGSSVNADSQSIEGIAVATDSNYSINYASSSPSRRSPSRLSPRLSSQQITPDVNVLSQLLQDATSQRTFLESQLNESVALNQSLEERVQVLEARLSARAPTPDPLAPSDNEAISALGIELHDSREAEEHLSTRVRELEITNEELKHSLKVKELEFASNLEAAVDKGVSEKIAIESAGWVDKLAAKDAEFESKLASQIALALELERAKFKSQQQALQNQIHQLQQAERSSSQLKSNESDVASHESHLETIAALRAAVADQIVETETFSSQAQVLQGELRTVTQERDTSISESKQRSVQVKALQGELEKLHVDLTALTRLETVESQLNSTKSENAALSVEIETWKCRVQELEKLQPLPVASETINQQIDILQAKLDATTTENANLKLEIESLKWDQEWPSLGASTSPKDSPKGASARNFSDSASILVEVETLREQVAQLSRETQVLTGEAESERVRAHELQTQCTQLKNQLETSAAVAPTAADERVAALEQEVQQLQRYLKASEEDNGELREQIDELEEAVKGTSTERSRVEQLPDETTHAAQNQELIFLKDELNRLNGMYETEQSKFLHQSSRLEEEISELKKYLRAAEEDNTELRDQIETLEESIQGSRQDSPTQGAEAGEVRRLEIEVANLKKYLQAAEERSFELQDQLDVLRALNTSDQSATMEAELDAEIMELKQRLKAADEENAFLKDQIETLEQQTTPTNSNSALTPSAVVAVQKASVTEEWDSWDDDAVSSNDPAEAPAITTLNRISDLETQLTISETEKISALQKLASALEERDTLSTQLSDLESQIDDADNAKIKALEDLTRALEDRERLNQEVREACLERDVLLQKVSTVSEDVVKLREEIVAASRERDAVIASATPPSNPDLVRELHEKVQSLEAAQSLESEKLRNVEMQLAASEEKLGFLQYDFDTLSQTHEELNRAHDQLFKEHADLVALKERIVHDAREKMGLLEQENVGLINQAEQLRTAGASVYETLKALEEEKEELLDEHERLMGAHDEVVRAHAELVSRETALKDEVESANARLDVVKAELQTVQAQHAQMRDVGSEVMGLKESLAQENAELLKQMETLKVAGATLVEERSRLEEECDALAAQVDELNYQLATLTEEKYNLETQLDAARSEVEGKQHLYQEVCSRADRFEKLYREVETKAANDANELVDTLRNLTEENADMKSKLSGLTDELNSVRYDNQDLSKMNTDLLNQRDVNEQDMVSKALELESAGFRIQELEEQIQSLSMSISETSQRLESEKGQLIEQLVQAEAQYKSLAEVSEQHDFEKSQLSEQLSEAESKYATTLETLRQLEAERDHIFQQLSEIQSRSIPADEVEQLRLQLEESEARYDQLFTDGEAHTVDLENQLNAAMEEIGKFEAVRSEMQYEIGFLKERLAAEEEFSAGEHAAKNALTSETAELQSNCLRLEQQLRDMEISLSNSEDVLQRVTAKLSNAEDEVMTMTEDLASSRRDKGVLEEALAQARFELEELLTQSSNNAEVQNDVARLRESLAAIELERNEAIERSELVQRSLEEAQERYHGLEQQLEAYAQDSERLQQAVESATRDQEYYQQQLSDMQFAHSHAEQTREAILEEKNQLLNQLNGKESHIREIQNSLEEEIMSLKVQINEVQKLHEEDVESRLQKQATAFSEANDAKEREIFELNGHIANLTREAEDACLRANELADELRASQERESYCENSLKNVEREFEMAMVERDEVQRKFLEGAEMLETLKANLETADKQTNHLLAEKDSAIQNLQQYLDESRQLAVEKENSLQAEKLELASRCNDLENQWKHIQIEFEGLMSQYTETQNALDTANYRIQEADVRIDALDQERTMLSTERDSLERQAAELRHVETSQRTEIDDLHLRISQADERIKTLEQLVDSLELQRAQFNSVINNETTLMQDISHKQSIIASLEQELMQLKNSPRAQHVYPSSVNGLNASSGGKMSIENEVSLLRQEVRNKEEELLSSQSFYKQAIAEMEEKINNYIKLNKSSVQSMELYRDELLKKSGRLEVVEEELFKLKSGSSNIRETPDTSLLDISKYDEAIDRAGKTARTLDELVQSASSAKRNISSFQNIDKAHVLDVLATQIGTLIRSTEANANISQRILGEVSRSLPNRGFPATDDGQMKLIVQSQSSILDEHKRLLNDVELLSRLFREGGSPKKQSMPFWEAPQSTSGELASFAHRLTEKVEDYLRSVSTLTSTKQSVLDDIRRGSLSKTVLSSLNILISGLEDVEANNSTLRKDFSHLSALLNSAQKATVDDARNLAGGVSQMTLSKKPDSSSQEYRLTSREYSDLVTRAGQSERYQQQIENSQTLLAEHVREIQVLQEAFEAMSTKLSREHSNANVSDVATFRVMTRQIDELKKVWSHELGANMVLRNLIAKTQAEGMVGEQEARKQQIALREEFDELVVLLEESHREAEALRGELEKKEQLLRNAEVHLEEKFNTRFFEMEQQHIEQNQQLEDMYDKERTALNKLVSNLEKERNRLVAEVDEVKPQIKELEGLRQEIVSLKAMSRGNESVGRREQDLVADLQVLERQLHDERKINERRLMDREAEWQRILDDERRRRVSSGEYPGSVDRHDDAVRVFRSQKEHLEQTLMLRDNQIHTLEVRIQELLQEGDLMSPRRGGASSRREMEMERDLQSSFNQIRDLKNQLGVIDQSRKDLETQLSVEKDRSKDLKRRYIHQQRLLEDQEDAINTAIRPAPRRAGSASGSVEEHLREEIAYLHQQLHITKTSRNDIVAVIRETLANTLGDVSIEVSAVPSLRHSNSSHQLQQHNAVQIDMNRLRTQMSSLIAEVIYLRALANRLFLWRADLKYQKVYLSLKVDDLSASQQVTLKFLREMGVDDAPAASHSSGSTLRPLQKLKSCVNVVIGVYRMMVMARDWQDTLQENSRDYFAPSGNGPEFMTDYEEDAGMLTDTSIRSSSGLIRAPPPLHAQQQGMYGSNHSMVRSTSSNLRDVDAGYGRGNSGKQRYASGDMDSRYASDASDASVTRRTDLDGRRSVGASAGRTMQSGPSSRTNRSGYGNQLNNGVGASSMMQQPSRSVGGPAGSDPRWMSPGNGITKNGPQPSRSLRRRE
ncbi:hypothetical protein CcCBS67573_g02206 [Chytriomyces confervae]|uniref:Pericentrin/AKAP-450 centrosomal targeting domain-containing protein n=1 Tax=Chytriomyces confervae TaxID=246404 RepID=A0A507FJD4_9FUNG|nr:hypothetical protein CcCBS67573_g02206 [Chytriomyces confervae]